MSVVVSCGREGRQHVCALSAGGRAALRTSALSHITQPLPYRNPVCPSVRLSEDSHCWQTVNHTWLCDSWKWDCSSPAPLTAAPERQPQDRNRQILFIERLVLQQQIFGRWIISNRNHVTVRNQWYTTHYCPESTSNLSAIIVFSLSSSNM